jgi:hypothetical protein
MDHIMLSKPLDEHSQQLLSIIETWINLMVQLPDFEAIQNSKGDDSLDNDDSQEFPELDMATLS